MFGSIFSIIIAIFIWLQFHSQTLTPNSDGLALILTLIALPFLLIIPLITLFAWGPLQKAEQNSTPRLLEMFRQDWQLRALAAWMILFSLVTLVLGLVNLMSHLVINILWISGWIIGFGITIDACYLSVKRVMSYLNPLAVSKMFTQKAASCVQNDKELELCDWIDALSEVALKAIQRHSLSIAQLALGEQQKISRLFLQSAKGINHPKKESEAKDLGFTDKVSYTLFFLYQRLDTIFEAALKNKIETTCSFLFTILGKISVDAAKYDVSLASAPLRFLGKFALKAQEAQFNEATLTATCVFLEVAKILVNEVNIAYADIKDPFLSIINGLEMITKDAFRRDKSTDISLLKQPFKDLRLLFEEEKIKGHQDTPLIVQNIDRVIGEYEALQMVMTTLPTIPTMPEQENQN